MTDYKEEQNGEIEALESIYLDEMEGKAIARMPTNGYCNFTVFGPFVCLLFFTRSNLLY